MKNLKSRFPHASQSFLALNGATPDLPPLDSIGSFASKKRRDDGQDAARGAELERAAGNEPLAKGKKKKADRRRFLVRITSVRDRLLDEDNCCSKFCTDLCRYAGILPSDAPGTAKIETLQRKPQKGEAQHTIVEVFEIPEDSSCR